MELSIYLMQMDGLQSNQLEAFFAVAQTKSFTKAAAQLFITQSALSQRILNLEAELGTTLFIRDRAGLRLTEVAQKLVRYCQVKNDLENDFRSSMMQSKTMTGVVRIGGFSSVMRSVIVPALAPLFQEHESLELQIFTKEVADLLPSLKTGEVDFVISDQKYDRDEFESVLIGHEQNVLIERIGYKGSDVYLDHDPLDEITNLYLRKIGLKSTNIRKRYLDDVYGLIDGVKHGFGRAVLPKHLILKEKGLKILNPDVVLKSDVYLAFYKQPYYSALHHRIKMDLIQNCKDHLKA